MTQHRPRQSPQEDPEAAASTKLARHGLSLPRNILRALENNGIYCFPGISVEHQHLAHRFVLKGTESGGAVESMGRYCGYLNRDGQPLPWLQPLDSFGGNGRHAIVIASELVRMEMLRIENTYELLISRHTLVPEDNGIRPQLHSTVVFRGRAGTLPAEFLTGNGRQSRVAASPVFHTNAGEIQSIPPRFDAAILAISSAVRCIGCKHAHIAIRSIAAKEDAS
jgi:hypothetical protein